MYPFCIPKIEDQHYNSPHWLRRGNKTLILKWVFDSSNSHLGWIHPEDGFMSPEEAYKTGYRYAMPLLNHPPLNQRKYAEALLGSSHRMTIPF